MVASNRLCVVLILTVVCSISGPVEGLRCYSCSGEDYCKSTIKRYPQRVGRCHVKDGKCFARRDPNGEVYLGCIDDAFWPGVPWRWYKRCEEDWERGWIYNGVKRPIVWCLCDHDDCNVNIDDTGSKPKTTQSTVATVTATDDTQV